MRRTYGLAIVSALLVSAVPARGQSVNFDFESGGDQGWGHKFDNDASEAFPVNLIAGSNRMAVLRNGDFQEAERNTGNSSEAFYMAMDAASANEAGYYIEYDWYVDTAPGNYGSYLQLGTYINTGSGYYAQDFPNAGKDVELDGTQLGSGQVFSGTVSETFAAKGYDMPTGETFFRLGLIINGDGAATVHFDNIRVRPVPEPTALALVGFATAGLAALRRRRK
ncbi:MAG: PEP-CTERM sorting domain-containing protein [Pirellulales bacterium]|nr:PEP-CTERM sorting domain-containing protein [Pirellulales bacterium]